LRFRNLKNYYALQNTQKDGMSVITVPVLQDNYSYVLIDKQTNQAAAIDVADAEPILRVLQDQKLDLTHILTTHHHEYAYLVVCVLIIINTIILVCQAIIVLATSNC
jgi:hypothetical protein